MMAAVAPRPLTAPETGGRAGVTRAVPRPAPRSPRERWRRRPPPRPVPAWLHQCRAAVARADGHRAGLRPVVERDSADQQAAEADGAQHGHAGRVLQGGRGNAAPPEAAARTRGTRTRPASARSIAASRTGHRRPRAPPPCLRAAAGRSARSRGCLRELTARLVGRPEPADAQALKDACSRRRLQRSTRR